MLLNPYLATTGVGTGGGAVSGYTNRGTGNSNSAGTTIVVQPSGTIPTGSTAVLVISMDNASGAGGNLTATSYTDSVGNIWYVRMTGVGGSANTNVEGATLSSKLTADFTTGANLTVNLTTSTQAKAWTLTELTPGTANTWLFFHGAWGAIQTGSATPTLTGVSGSIGDTMIGCGGSESADLWTEDPDWLPKQSDAGGTGAAGASVISQPFQCVAYASQTYNPTLTAADCRLGIAIFSETDPKCRTIEIGTASEASTVMPIRQPLAIGSIGVLCLAVDNADTGTAGAAQNIPGSINDSKGNTWTLRQTGIYDPGAASAGVEIGIYTSVLSVALVPGDTITCTYTIASATSKAYVIWEFAPQAAGTMSYVTGGTSITGLTGTPSVTTSSITSGDYVIGMCGLEQSNSFTGDADTSNGTWKTQATAGGGTGTGAMSITSQWKLTTGTGTQSYDPTCTSADTMIGWVSVRET